MNKICTSLKQSKKLVEFGINVNTADMYYTPPLIKGHTDYIPHLKGKLPIDWDVEQAIPCWSLSALIGLMPTDDKKDEYYVDTESHSDYHTVNYRNCWDGCIHSECSEESLLDAAFEMVVWLKENRKI